MNARKLMVVFWVFASAGTVQGASQAVDVVIYLTGADLGPGSEYRARTVLKGVFARIGIRISWVHDKPKTAGLSEDPVVVQVLIASEPSHKVHADALAYTGAVQKKEEESKITVLWNRIQLRADGSADEAQLLAHVLAHEIGHILKGTNGHADTGVMKAHWVPRDLGTMKSHALEFTAADVCLMKEELIRRKAQVVR